ncbi:hypothetical protein M8998_07295 [Sphingobacterium sp. lm-10]|uniref:hypothetical protein n=1 Tax=Sphingobacterium sp. lm-10 TaxID=2944904 RepID=UPI002022935E|nr:hypothetical protein [Sphingobacterium sp. lm-10]MCL7987739.1 hypothetical protein [Sphingobacterium sp. lm-10]
MIELLAFALSLIILICFFVLCANTAGIKKEIITQNKLQMAILRKLESWNDPTAVSSESSGLPYYLFLYDSEDRKLLVKNSAAGSYVTLPGTSEYALPMTSKTAIVQIEVIHQDGVINDIQYVKLVLKPVVDNLIDIADHLKQKSLP